MKVTSLPRFAIFVCLCVVIWYVAFLMDAKDLSNKELTTYIQEKHGIESKVTKRDYDYIELKATETGKPFEIYTGRTHNFFEEVGFDTYSEGVTRSAYEKLKPTFEALGFREVMEGIPLVVTYPEVALDKSKPVRTLFYFKYEGYLDHLRIQEKDYEAIMNLITVLSDVTPNFNLTIVGVNKIEDAFFTGDASNTPPEERYGVNSGLDIEGAEAIADKQMLKERIIEASRENTLEELN